MPTLAQRPASASTRSDWTNSSFPAFRRPWIVAVAVCLVTAVLVFVLPLFVHGAPAARVSDSNLAGFNNGVAVVCAAGLGLLVLAVTLWVGRTRQPVPMVNGQPLGGLWVGGVLLVSGAILALEGWIVAASHTRYLGDAGYFMEQAATRRDTGHALYTQMEFAYGPLLLFPEIYLSKWLHSSLNAAYFSLLVVESTVGLLLLVALLNALPMRNSLRKAALVLFAIGALTPHLGVNYTFFRFITPYALLFFGTRSRSVGKTVLFLSVAVSAVLLISPELGMAMAVGVCVFGLVRASQSGWAWLLVAFVPLAVMAALLSTLGHSYLIMAASFSKGSLNLPVGPYPHIVVVLFALVWLVPFGLGRMLDLQQVLSARLLGLCATAIAFMPAALGRSDPVHVLFNGMGLLVLSLVVVSASTPRVRLAWVSVLALFVLWSHFVNQRFFQVRTTYVFAQSVYPRLPSPLQHAAEKAIRHRGPTFSNLLKPQPETDFRLDMAMLNRVAPTGCISAPVYISPLVEDQLRTVGRYHPGFFAFWVDMMDLPAEQRSIATANQCPWMLLPAAMPESPVALSARLAALQGWTLPYRERSPELYKPGEAFGRNMREHWTAVLTTGPYVLYRQTGAGGAS